jgi:hypothetical protein
VTCFEKEVSILFFILAQTPDGRGRILTVINKIIIRLAKHFKLFSPAPFQKSYPQAIKVYACRLNLHEEIKKPRAGLPCTHARQLFLPRLAYCPTSKWSSLT